MELQLTITTEGGVNKTADDVIATLRAAADQLEREYEGHDAPPYPQPGEWNVVYTGDRRELGRWKFV